MCTHFYSSAGQQKTSNSRLLGLFHQSALQKCATLHSYAIYGTAKFEFEARGDGGSRELVLVTLV
jgi:hypothetical protein